MSSSQPDRADVAAAGQRQPPGLRERKKARTRAAIQREAVHLFRAQGFSATTIEQIAEAAEVAPSTVFRYFPTKEDLVVLENDLQPMIAEFHAQPPELTPLQAMHRAILATFGTLTPNELDERREREHRELLVLSIPELWASNLDNITSSLDTVAEAVAERCGRSADDPRVRSFVGAFFGAILPVWFAWAHDPEVDLLAGMDDALTHLSDGLHL
ncbi:TetR/AcrR family transcriptional regulator [Phytoactinopolyspora mesophila]|uniref:TetR family transcriptional regulator n=1 Tax=Phytoactinopolyspora mesophila TaxID=2650750 RepID=A0A7K3M9S3_9ACTN|nr:TetR family transcriptional regulator [Phytoactinopolyspora mesophila]NDL60034.1 TetR family transcriptional regulator [Phytoactinopolyspora mesophila]